MDCTVVYRGMVIKITRMNNCTVQVADRGRSWPKSADRARRGRSWPHEADRGRSWPIVADRGPVIKIALAKTRKKMPNMDSTIVYCSAEIKKALATIGSRSWTVRSCTAAW